MHQSFVTKATSPGGGQESCLGFDFLHCQCGRNTKCLCHIGKKRQCSVNIHVAVGHIAMV